jgi:hypothetical protein
MKARSPLSQRRQGDRFAAPRAGNPANSTARSRSLEQYGLKSSREAIRLSHEIAR